MSGKPFHEKDGQVVWLSASTEDPMARSARPRLSFSYDQEADVLYVALGRARHAIGELRENGVVIRRDPTTHHIVEFTIIDFTRHFATRHAKPITTPVSAVLQPV